jgi:hypothetical protein
VTADWGGAAVARFTWLMALRVAFGMRGKNSTTVCPVDVWRQFNTRRFGGNTRWHARGRLRSWVEHPQPL